MGGERIGKVKIGCTLNFSLLTIPGMASRSIARPSHTLCLQLFTGYSRPVLSFEVRDFCYFNEKPFFCQGIYPCAKIWHGDLLFIQIIL